MEAMKHLLPQFLVAVSLALVDLPLSAQDSAMGAVQHPDLLMLASQPPGPGVPSGWKVRPVRGKPPPMYSIQGDGQERSLRIAGRGAAALLYRELEVPLDSASSMAWSWRVLETPASADIQVKRRDDSPIRVFVVFGRWQDLGRSGHAIFYTWGNEGEEELTTRSHVSRRIAIVRLARSGSTDETWRDVRTNPSGDFARIFGGRADPITTVGFMQDTDQTGEAAIAELREFRVGLPADPRHRLGS
jgi:hypothetical protein